jgi:peptide/nickel transport system ATP-binding protein
MIFQDPMGSLDPRFKVGRIIAEPLRSLKIDGDHRDRVAELLDAVELPADSVTRYPHEFSGGQRQRIAIARALAPSPDILIADEPVSALDMSIQTITLDLLAHLKDEYGLTMVFISHDLSVVHEICDRVAVMQHGRVVEQGQVDEVFLNPKTDYTERLIAAIPRLDGT